MEHPILMRIVQEGFMPLGWFAARDSDRLPGAQSFVILIGNAGPDMFRRYAAERGAASTSLDDWTRKTVDRLAAELDATAAYPFDTPHLPFLTWARRGGGGHVSPLGLNVHATFGLWHAYRAALLFPVAFDLPRHGAGAHPCDSCEGKPCLSACPVSAFDGSSYNVSACGRHILEDPAQDCVPSGCKARLACPVGRDYTYGPQQMAHHMEAFRASRARERQ
jgi:epoxyqueuosine reductase QueG